MSCVKMLVAVSVMVSIPCMMVSCAQIREEDTIRATVRDVKFAKEGDTVQLFYGMSKMAKEEFCPGAVVPVYRFSRDGIGRIYRSKEKVGKIKVINNLEEHFMEAVVIEGILRPGDIAMQAHSECMIEMPIK